MIKNCLLGSAVCELSPPPMALVMCKPMSASDRLRASTLASATTRGPDPADQVFGVYSLAASPPPPPLLPQSPESRRHRAPLQPPAPPQPRLFKQCLATDTCVSVTLASSVVDQRGRMVRTGLRPLAPPPSTTPTSSSLGKRCTLLRLEAGVGGCNDTAIGAGSDCGSAGPPPVVGEIARPLFAGLPHALSWRRAGRRRRWALIGCVGVRGEVGHLAARHMAAADHRPAQAQAPAAAAPAAIGHHSGSGGGDNSHHGDQRRPQPTGSEHRHDHRIWND